MDHAKEPKCWKLIEALIDNPNGVRVEVGNVAKSATVLALEVIVRVGNDIDGQIAKKIFGKIVDLRAECDDSEVLAESRSAVRAMAALGAADFRSKLEEIWGRGLDAAQGRGYSILKQLSRENFELFLQYLTRKLSLSFKLSDK